MEKIIGALEESVFTQYDFKFSFPKTGRMLFSASFIGKPGYTYELYEAQKADEWLARRAPGTFKNTEDIKIEYEGKIYETIKEWTKLIREDIKSKDFVLREIEDVTDKLEEQIKQHISDPDKHLTKEQIDAIHAKFDDLLNKFAELRSRNEITEKELNQLKQEFNTYKANAESFPRGTFIRTTVNRIRRILKNEGTKETVRELISSSIRSTLGLPF